MNMRSLSFAFRWTRTKSECCSKTTKTIKDNNAARVWTIGKIPVSIFICCSQHKHKLHAKFLEVLSRHAHVSSQVKTIAHLWRGKPQRKSWNRNAVKKYFSFHIKLHTKTAYTNQCAYACYVCVLPLFFGIMFFPFSSQEKLEPVQSIVNTKLRQ